MFLPSLLRLRWPAAGRSRLTLHLPCCHCSPSPAVPLWICLRVAPTTLNPVGGLLLAPGPFKTNPAPGKWGEGPSPALQHSCLASQPTAPGTAPTPSAHPEQLQTCPSASHAQNKPCPPLYLQPRQSGLALTCAGGLLCPPVHPQQSWPSHNRRAHAAHT